jgi:putative DNA primase/helicase
MHNGRHLDRARRALHAIPPNVPRAEWVIVGMAAQAAGLNFDDFNEWSAGSPDNYKERDARAT